MTEIKKVIVLGASGDQGIPLIGALIDSGFDITAGVRRADAMQTTSCLLYTSPSPRDRTRSRMPSSA